MKLEEIMQNVMVFIEPLNTSGEYDAKVRGSLPSGETIRLDIELSGCYTSKILEDTISAQLEEILECKYHYEVGEVDESDILYDGGTFK